MNKLRMTLTFLTAAQTMIAAALGFADVLPPWLKIGLVILSAGLMVVVNQMPSWTDTTPPEPPLPIGPDRLSSIGVTVRPISGEHAP